jgi:RND family efflux transporter MFP subunit
MRKIAVFLIVLVIASAGASYWVKNRKTASPEKEKETAKQTVAVDVVSPSRRTLQRTVEIYGSLSPKTTTEVKNEVAGHIQRMTVKEWDRVKAGDVLLEMDPADFKLQLNRSEAGLKMAKAQLLKAKVDLNRARREWSRASKLKEGGLITGQDLDEQKTGLESAEAQVAVADAQIGQAESQVAEARRNLGKATIHSPIDGTVSQRSVDVGDFKDVGGPLFTIVDNRTLDFTASVSTTDLSRVSQGQTLDFTVDGIAGRSFQGTIKRVNPMVRDTDRSGRIVAEVLNDEGILKGGLYARGQVAVEERRDVTVVPKATLVGWDLEKSTARVFVVDSAGVARSVPVITGLTGDDMVEIRSGLSGSEMVVIRGGFNIREGDTVQVAGRQSEKVPAARPHPSGQVDEAAMAAEVSK